jgi:hypothetical protein
MCGQQADEASLSIVCIHIYIKISIGVDGVHGIMAYYSVLVGCWSWIRS